MFFLIIKANAQEIKLVDNKGTIINVNNNNVTTANTAPSNPVENDIWFDTSVTPTQIKIYDGAPVNDWLNLKHKGTPGAVFFAGADGTPNENTSFTWDDITSTLTSQNLSVPGTIQDSNGDVGTDGQVLSSVTTAGVTTTDWIDSTSENIYNTDGTLTGTTAGQRTMSMGTNQLNFNSNTNSRTTLTLKRNNASQQVGIGFRNPDDSYKAAIAMTSGNVTNKLDFYAGNNSAEDGTTLTRVLSLIQNGQLEFSQYTGTNFAVSTLPYLLGVDDTNGQVFKINSSLATDNIYTANGTLEANRTITTDGFQLNILNTTSTKSTLTFNRNATTSETGIAFRNNGNFYDAAITMGSGVRGTLDFYSGNAFADVNSLEKTFSLHDDNQIEFSQYGNGTTYLNNAPAYFLGVQADGQVVEIEESTIGSDDQNANEVALLDTSNNYAATTAEAAFTEIAIEVDRIDVDQAIGNETSDTAGANPSANTIATFTNGAGTPTTINETVTTLTQDDSTTPTTTVANITGDITYTNELGTATTVQVVSTDIGNTITVGADGGAFSAASGGNTVTKSTTDTPDTHTFATAPVEDDMFIYELGSGDHSYVYIYDDGAWVLIAPTKAARIFYPPSIAIDASAIISGETEDIYQQYADQFGLADATTSASSGGSGIPVYAADELEYYVTYYDNTVFGNLSISDMGVLSYDIISVPADDNTLINVVFVVKPPGGGGGGGSIIPPAAVIATNYTINGNVNDNSSFTISFTLDNNAITLAPGKWGIAITGVNYQTIPTPTGAFTFDPGTAVQNADGVTWDHFLTGTSLLSAVTNGNSTFFSVTTPTAPTPPGTCFNGACGMFILYEIP